MPCLRGCLRSTNLVLTQNNFESNKRAFWKGRIWWKLGWCGRVMVCCCLQPGWVCLSQLRASGTGFSVQQGKHTPGTSLGSRHGAPSLRGGGRGAASHDEGAEPPVWCQGGCDAWRSGGQPQQLWVCGDWREVWLPRSDPWALCWEARSCRCEIPSGVWCIHLPRDSVSCHPPGTLL